MEQMKIKKNLSKEIEVIVLNPMEMIELNNTIKEIKTSLIS